MVDSAQTVGKALELVRILARSRGPLPVRAAADRAGISAGSAYRIVNALESHGAVRRLPDGRLVLGDLFVQVASAVEYYPRLRMAAAGPMMDLRAACEMETVGLYVRLNTAEMTCIETLPGLHRLQNVERPYEAVPIARGAVSLVFLAVDLERHGREAVRQYLEHLPAEVRPRDVAQTLRRVAQVGEGSSALSVGTRIAGAASIACAIPADVGYPTAALAVSGVADRFSRAPTRDWGQHLKETAVRIARAMTEG